MSLPRWFSVGCLALLVTSVVPQAGAAPTQAQAESKTEKGYIGMADGTRLKYTVIYPDDNKLHPVLLQYNGYAAGSNPYDNGLDSFGPRMLARGFAILGVSMRGTGCSEGSFDLFSRKWSTDGYAVVEWAARQPWSNGRIGMVGASYSGISQLLVASQPPPHLAAIAPMVTITDLYRDVSWPGGIFNASFAGAWTGLQKYGYGTGVVPDTARGDGGCAPNVAEHNDPQRIVVEDGASHPYADHRFYERFLTENDLSAIHVPTLLQSAWQDEQLGSRVTEDFGKFNPRKTWFVVGNGTHSSGFKTPWFTNLMERFFLQFVAGRDTNFERVPHVNLQHEIDLSWKAGWVSSAPSWPPPADVKRLHLHPDAALRLSPAQKQGELPYAYPLPAPHLQTFASGAEPIAAYKVPVPPGGSVSFTSPALARDVEMFGPSSVDLWLSSTAADTDIQVTVTEVRPDGMEMFVQRGWLRASHRKLDAKRSTPTRPFHTHTERDVEPLEAGVPTRMRVEVWPVDHVFRKGSAIRVYVEAPVGMTGFRQLQVNPTPAVNTIHVGGRFESRFVLGLRRDADDPKGFPACDTVVNQPCRLNTTPVPPGKLDP